MRKALYRKYRPTRLADVIGQDEISRSLDHSLKSGKTSHAYLFIGPRGTGKTSVARILAHAVNDFDYQIEDNYLDIIEIDAASNTGVDNIRELREKAIMAPSVGKYKVYIIDEVHMLSRSASNALLKTLEEPPAHVIFIMATTEKDKVPITISSRTQIYNFHLVSPEVMLPHLQNISKQEKIPIDDEALKVIIRRGGGSFRDTLSLLDQISTLGLKTITAPDVESALGLPSSEAISTLLSAYSAGDATTIRTSLTTLLSAGLSPESIASELISAIIAAPEPLTLPLLSSLPGVSAPFPEAKLLLALLEHLPAFQAPAALPPQPQATPAPEPPRIADSPILDTPPEPSTPSRKPATKKPPQDPTPKTSPQEKPIEPSKSPKQPPTDFSWDDLLASIREKSEKIALELAKCTYELTDEALHIFPATSFSFRILERPETHDLFSGLDYSFAIEIHEAGEHPQPKDETISQISAIMGDVKELDGDMPF